MAYSNIETIRVKGADQLTIYPNPAKNTISIDFPSFYNKARLKIRDLNGRIVTAVNNIAGAKYAVDISGPAAGKYFVVLINNGEKYSSSFLKQ